MNEKLRAFRSSAKLAALAFAGMLSVTSAVAGDAKDMKDVKEISAPECGTKDWTVELGSGVTFSNVRSDSNPNYTLVPISFTASLTLDEVGNDNILDGIFRGYTEFFFRGDYDFIVHGPENYIAGVLVGPRYNFVQQGWPIVPFIEAGVGVVFTDANAGAGGFGQDFNFTFTAAAGFKYKIDDEWFLRLACEFQHISNAGMSEPTNPNNPIDALGPKLSLGYAF